MSNIYYSPEEFGLEVVAEIDYSSQSYEFDTRVVWKNSKTEMFYTARDSGCSCPTPFEDFHLGNIDVLDFSSLRSEVLEESSKSYSYISQGDAQEFLEKVRFAIALG